MSVKSIASILFIIHNYELLMVNLNKNMKFSAYFLCILLLAAFDIWFDFQHGIPFRYLIFEGLVFFLALVGFNFFLQRFLDGSKQQKVRLSSLQKEVDRKDQQLGDLSKKLKSFKEAFAEDVENTFREWEFTKAETQVAGLLLKGLSIKEIATIRNANENTVRSQCTSIYRKSKLANRSQLSSYFFDDLI